MTGARRALGGPTDDLLLAYRGTAYFLRWLALLPERAYDEPGDPSARFDRRITIATVGYDARGWANLAEGIRERRPDAATFERGGRAAAISWGATLPPRALRHLVEHAAVHLAVEWRDLPVDAWDRAGVDDAGVSVPISRTPWLRARQTWLAAVDLGTGGRFSDFPAAVLDRLIVERGGRIRREGGEYLVSWRDSMLTGPLPSIARRMLREAPDEPRQLVPIGEVS